MTMLDGDDDEDEMLSDHNLLLNLIFLVLAVLGHNLPSSVGVGHFEN